MTIPQPNLPLDAPGKNAHWLSGIAAEMMVEPCAIEFIDTLRDELGLEAPVDERELNQNRAVPRTRVARAVQRLAETYDWEGDLSFLNYVYRPELIESIFAAWMRESDDDLSPEDDAWIDAISKALHWAFLASGFHQLGIEIFSNLLTECAINGELRTPPPLPSWFTGSVIEVPFFGDHIVVALCTRFSDHREMAKQLVSECRRVFQTGHGGKGQINPKRDLWVIDQYQKIKDQLPEQQEHDKYMAALLDHDEEELLEATVINELLRRFAQSEWKGELTRYALTNSKGKRDAKNFLKQIVHRQRVTMRATLELMSPFPHA